MKRALITIPTYNERGNITALIHELFSLEAQTPYVIQILIIDDRSPDGTGEEVKRLQHQYDNLYLLEGQKAGLGAAYRRGFDYAFEFLDFDVIIMMDADFSHPPADVIRLLESIDRGNDVAVGSRYAEGGMIPGNWPLKRILNTRVAHLVARYVGGIKTDLAELTGGFKAMRREALEKIPYQKARASGFGFQIFLTNAFVQLGLNTEEVPICFRDRRVGSSKMRLKDISEFVRIAAGLNKHSPFRTHVRYFLNGLFGIVTAVLTYFGALYVFQTGLEDTLATAAALGFISFFMTLLSAQALYNIQTTIYGWFDSSVAKQGALKTYAPPSHKITVLLPAYHEDQVIKETVQKIAQADYPAELLEVFVLCRAADLATITKAAEAIIEQRIRNTRILIYEGDIPGKPVQLNVGLEAATGDLVVIFDAEDDVSPQLFNIANTLFTQTDVDVLQAGVQLMDYNSHWYSVHNILEYYFQFRSRMYYQAKVGMLPLGGNTSFFRTTDLREVGGWDEHCLTEDAELGLRLSAAGKRFKVYYEGAHVTREETPENLQAFIKQRTRWNQGFIQVLRRPYWRQLPKRRQRWLALYTLTLPLILAGTLLLMPLFLWMAIAIKLPVVISLLSYIPLGFLGLLLGVQLAGLYEFAHEQKLHVRWRWYLITILTFIPFQFILGYAALRAMRRELAGAAGWEKTTHNGIHREVVISEAVA